MCKERNAYNTETNNPELLREIISEISSDLAKSKQDKETNDAALAIAARDQHDLRNRFQRYMSAVELARQALEEG